MSSDAGTGAPITVLYLDHTAKWSGGEIALLRLLEELDRSRVRPLVLLAEDGPLVPRLRDAGIETHILPLSEEAREVRKDTLGASAVLRHVGTLTHYLGYARAVARYAREQGANIIHTNSLKSDIYGALAGRIAGLPVVWHVRDHIDPTYLPRAAVAGFRSLAKSLPTLIVTNSESTKEKLFPGGSSKPCVPVHDGLAGRELTTPLPPMFLRPDEKPWKHDPPRIGILGRITPWKGQHVFLEAAAKLMAEGRHDARFVIVGAALFGEDEYDKRIREMAEKPPLAGKVEFTGFQTDVPAILRGLDILVHASTTPEPFGQVVIEGMAEGLPVIATDGGGVREIIVQNESGILVPMGDADAMAEALAVLLQSPVVARHIAHKGHVRVREHFTAARAARQMEEIYEQMQAAARGRARPRVRSSSEKKVSTPPAANASASSPHPPAPSPGAAGEGETGIDWSGAKPVTLSASDSPSPAAPGEGAGG